MVNTRRSLSGAHASPSTSSPPAAAPPPPPTTTSTPQLSRAQQAALKKLDIAGTDALKGTPKAAAAPKAAVQTYHYRGAVYAADANTPSAWLENQPKRYLKRGRLSSAGAEDGGDDSIAVGGEEEEEERRPAKRQRVPQKSKPAAAAAAAEISSRGKARPSLPAKRKAAALRDDDEDEDDNTMPRQPAWQTKNAEERLERLQERATAVPSKKAPIPDANTMTSEIQRRKQNAMRQQYQVAALAEDATKSAEEVERSKLVKLAKTQRLISAKIREWKMAKELMEAMKREAELKDHDANTPQQTNYQPPLDLTGSDSERSERSEHSKKDDNEEEELGEQWQREQDQTHTHSESPCEANEQSPPKEIPETSPAAPTQPSNHSPDPFTAAGASRPQTPQSVEKQHHQPATSTILTGANAFPHPSTRGYIPTKPPTTGERTERSEAKHREATNNKSPNTSNEIAPFTSLPPNASLPQVSAGGDPLRWTIRRSVSVEAGTGKERAEYAIEVTRLEGESKSAKVRRVRRERAVVENWARITGGRVVEESTGRRESGGSVQ
jgi:hypothetical protein